MSPKLSLVVPAHFAPGGAVNGTNLEDLLGQLGNSYNLQSTTYIVTAQGDLKNIIQPSTGGCPILFRFPRKSVGKFFSSPFPLATGGVALGEGGH